MSLLSLTDLTATRRGRTVLEAVSLTVEPGECIGLIGPKSSKNIRSQWDLTRLVDTDSNSGPSVGSKM